MQKAAQAPAPSVCARSEAPGDLGSAQAVPRCWCFCPTLPCLWPVLRWPNAQSALCLPLPSGASSLTSSPCLCLSSSPSGHPLLVGLTCNRSLPGGVLSALGLVCHSSLPLLFPAGNIQVHANFVGTKANLKNVVFPIKKYIYIYIYFYWENNYFTIL